MISGERLRGLGRRNSRKGTTVMLEISPADPIASRHGFALNSTYRPIDKSRTISRMPIRPDGRPPFRADHIGSLLRPPALRQAFRRCAAGEIGDGEFAQIQDSAIRDAVRM